MAASWCISRNIYLRHGLKTYKARQTQLTNGFNIFETYSTSALKNNKSKPYEIVKYFVATKPGDKKDTTVELPQAYSPQFVEAAWYDWWVQEGFFKPKENESGQKFVLCLPPPNVTGTLHLGHALTCAIQDAIVRWHRMRGLETLWIPGCDHAGIATQVVVEKQLWKKEGKTRHDVGREEFLKRVWEWKEAKGETIYNQMKKMGVSLDWSRTCFTMDENMSLAVREAFIRLHDEGLIYRSGRLVNWSCHLRSAISDIEVINEQIDGPKGLKVPGYEHPVVFGEMTQFAYPVVNSDQQITVSTTRLETMLGDTGVAVHPDDPRYSHLHGALLQHPIDGRHIPVITDDSVQQDFGTGAVKITPAHDHVDYQIGRRHNLLSVNVIDDQGLMENVPEQYKGMKRFHARQKVADALKEKGLYKGKQPHSMVLPVCQRCGDIIEPRIKDQWYVNCAELASNALQAVESGELTIYPDFHRKVWREFMSNEKAKDWCISRQIWWGHRIPAFRVDLKQNTNEGEELWVSAHTEEEACMKVESKLGITRNNFSLHQDEDVLDTWFSSALVPFSALGWPKQTIDLHRFYPNSLLETGNDILFFWVARMVMLGLKMTGCLPFSKVLLHGTLRDSKGRKMSKSLGNVIDPMDVIYGVSLEELQKQVERLGFDVSEMETAKKGQSQDFPDGIQECGTDALRFALCSYQFKDPEIRMNISHVHNYRQFCNKIWQAFKLVWNQLGPDFKPVQHLKNNEDTTFTPVDLWILSRLSHLVQHCDNNFRSYDLHLATLALYNFWFNDFCAVYLEYSKKMMDTPSAPGVRDVLYFVVDTFLRALSPFMPFLTEELYQRLGNISADASSVCLTQYPDPLKYNWYNGNLESTMERVQLTCNGALSLMKTFELSPKITEVYIQAPESYHFDDFLAVFASQLKCQSITFVNRDQALSGCIRKDIAPGLDVYIKVQDISKIQVMIKNLEEKHHNLMEKIVQLAKKGKKKHNDVDDKIQVLDEKARLVKEQIDILQQVQRNSIRGPD
ncbi:valine--tRNA ligase-like isoform X1 [Dreissena polymorpha]|uniref:Valine--tRNA ligase, mitochondrial n=1 Tax=Dreissena polymorpha TaxID=45954 RepID=A0A9D4FKZ8_DREPO|nr:valine--tRNA ligase-like isoform X1 [Dreissena polymorpha]KAH3799544.1 hypothetical protein DPMN_153154 [Dreissena polymorpha]